MPRTDPAERLLNLIIALTHARVRMTRSEIRDTVAGYEREDPSAPPEQAARTTAAFERMFERDKDDLRRMGVPLLTVTDSAHGDDIGYRIDVSEAALEAVALTPAEMAVVGLAADFWQDATLGADARQGVAKLAARATGGHSIEVPFAARSASGSAATGVLAEAIAERRAVSFAYASAASGHSIRQVEPWLLVLRGGQQYLIGQDRDRGQARTYRVSRIDGEVAIVGQPHGFDIPRDIDLGALVPTAAENHAIVAVRPDSAHALRRRGEVIGVDGQWDLVKVTYRHPDAMRAQILALAGAARVIEPVELRDAVVSFARAAVEVRGG